MAHWPFDQLPDVAAIVSHTVTEGAAILLVVHYSEDASWAFLDGGDFDVAQAKMLAMGEVLRLDPTLAEIADLPPGHTARRATASGAWTRQEDPEV